MKTGKLYIGESTSQDKHRFYSLLLLEDVPERNLDIEIKVLKTIVDSNSKEIITSEITYLSCAHICLWSKEFAKEFKFASHLKKLMKSLKFSK